MNKLIVSRNLIERVQAGMPLDKTFMLQRISALWSALADLGAATEQLTSTDDVMWLHDELLEAADALDTVAQDTLHRGDTL